MGGKAHLLICAPSTHSVLTLPHSGPQGEATYLQDTNILKKELPGLYSVPREDSRTHSGYRALTEVPRHSHQPSALPPRCRRASRAPWAGGPRPTLACPESTKTCLNCLAAADFLGHLPCGVHSTIILIVLFDKAFI